MGTSPVDPVSTSSGETEGPVEAVSTCAGAVPGLRNMICVAKTVAGEPTGVGPAGQSLPVVEFELTVR
jgi:hypothetical protein